MDGMNLKSSMENSSELKPKRIFELDLMRGTLIFLMCLQHLFYFFYMYSYCQVWNYTGNDTFLYQIGEVSNFILFGTPCNLIIMGIAWDIYFFMSGITSSFSNNNFKKAIKIFIFFISYYIIAALCQNFIKYPLILNFGMFLGYSCYAFIFHFFKKINLKIQIVIVAILMVVGIVFEITGYNLELNPLRWFNFSQNINMYYLDEWNVFPSIFFFFFGGIIGQIIYKNKESLFKKAFK